MKPTTKILAIALCTGALLTGCKQDPVAPVVVDSGKNNNPPSPTSATITGRVSLPAGVNGDVRNTRVAVYQNVGDWAADRTIAQVAADANGNYSISGLAAGTYYMDAWKDNNNNRAFDTGDYFQVHGSGRWPNVTLAPLNSPVGNTTKDLELDVIR